MSTDSSNPPNPSIDGPADSSPNASSSGSGRSGGRPGPAWWPLILLLPALSLLSSESVAVKPLWQVGLGAVVLFALFTLGSTPRLKKLDYAVVVLLSVAATHRLLFPGFPRGHDIMTHLWGTYGFYQAILAGNWLPRWIHHIGAGMPFLLFYPPTSFYAMLPFLEAGMTPYDAFKGGFMLFSALSGISMLFVTWKWTGDRRAALFAALAYVYAPYHLLQSHYRVAIAEAAAMVVIPPFLYYMLRAMSAPSRASVRPAVFWTALLTLTHPLSLSMGGTALGIWTLHRFRQQPTKVLVRALGLLALLGALGVGLAGFYTLPIAAEGKYVTIESSLGGKVPLYARHGLYPNQLLERREWSKWQKSEARGTKEEKNEQPFYFGLTLLALLPLARGRTDEEHRLVQGLRAMTLGTLALCLFPLDAVTGYLPPMRMLQFPWRFLTMATVGASILAGFALLRLLEAAQQSARPQLVRYVPALAGAVLIFDCFPYGGAALWGKAYTGIVELTDRGKTPDPLPLRVDRLQYPPADTTMDLSTFRRAYPEYFTKALRDAFYRAEGENEQAALERLSVSLDFDKNARNPVVLNPTPYAEFTPAAGGPARALEFTRAGEQIRVKLPGEAGKLVIKEMYFPGWEVLIGSLRPTLDQTADGLMQLDLEAEDTGEVLLYFSRTRWDRLGGWVLSLVVLVGLWMPLPGRRRSAPLEPSAGV